MLREVEEANKISMAMKEKEKQDQIRADEEIFKYVQARQQAEFEKQEMERKIKEEKEREVQRLRELQEKAADR